MIENNQWRLSIGLWYCRGSNMNLKRSSTCAQIWKMSVVSRGDGTKSFAGHLNISLTFVFLLILLSGDVERNPGPKTDTQLQDKGKDNLTNEVNDFPLLNEKPTKLAVLEQLAPIDSSWRQIGNGFRICHNFLQGLEESNKSNKTRLDHVIQKWIENDSKESPLTWKTVINIVEGPLVNNIAHANLIRKQLGVENQRVPQHGDDTLPTSSLHSDIQQYCDIIRKQYREQCINATNWPPQVGEDFYGRLALLEVKRKYTTSEDTQQKAWYMLRGNIDKIPEVTKDKQIDIQNILKRSNSSQSLRVVVDGPPGIGKTILCRKLLNMWAYEKLTCEDFVLVLYCPLRKKKVAQAKTIADLHVYKSPKVLKVAEWITSTEGEGLLIIFDGWDELSSELQQSSLATEIICRERLSKCSVLVTSRTYASSSLLDMSSINRYVQVMGFLEEDVKDVVRGTLEKDKYLAEKLIADLEIRTDVMSLCYIPLVCSMVILVYQKEKDMQLPKTLTELYEKFILQTIRRHAKNAHNIKPRSLYNLHDLPSVLKDSFQELCHFAYLNLAESNPRMTFSVEQIHDPCLHHSSKENYLGLMTTFTVYDDESYQFLHLTIQEYLAARYIAQVEESHEIFAKHFKSDHFRMCLRFVAGITKFKHKSYQQYFNIDVDLQCKTQPPYMAHICYTSHFYKNLKLNRPHISQQSSRNVDFFLFHLLYESQNKDLCDIFSQSLTNNSLCLDGVFFSSFDILVLAFYLNSSKKVWTCLDFSWLHGKKLQLFSDKLTNNVDCEQLKIKCETSTIQMEMYLDDVKMNTKSLKKFLLPFYKNLKECNISFGRLNGMPLPLVASILLDLLRMPCLKTLHFTASINNGEIKIGVLEQLEESTCINSMLNELLLEINIHQISMVSTSTILDTSNTINSVIKGLTRNKSIQTFSLVYVAPIRHDIIDNLLRGNNTLRALDLTIPDFLSSPSIVHVNVPLTALKIGRPNAYVEPMFPLQIPAKGLECLILQHPYMQPINHLFQSHPNLQNLVLTLETAESIIELFTILQSNTTLKALRLRLDTIYFDITSFHPSLKNMLQQNQTIELFQIDVDPRDSICIFSNKFLIEGLALNSRLKSLSIPIQLSLDIIQMKRFFKILSYKENIQEIEVCLIANPSKSELGSNENEAIFYKQILPGIAEMLETHTTIRFLNIECKRFTSNSKQFQFVWINQNTWTSESQHILQTIFLHPTLQYFGILSDHTLLTSLKNTLQLQEETFHAMHRQKQPQKPLPIVEWLGYSS